MDKIEIEKRNVEMKGENVKGGAGDYFGDSEPVNQKSYISLLDKTRSLVN
jgi:hypothetical protein